MVEQKERGKQKREQREREREGRLHVAFQILYALGPQSFLQPLFQQFSLTVLKTKQTKTMTTKDLAELTNSCG